MADKMDASKCGVMAMKSVEAVDEPLLKQQNKLSDNEIIKALEEAISKMEENCIKGFELRITGKAVKDILDLINRQNAEIERIQDSNRRLKDDMRMMLNNHNGSEQIRAKAIKEFAERLKDKSEDCADWGHPYVLCTDIESLVKEMVGE